MYKNTKTYMNLFMGVIKMDIILPVELISPNRVHNTHRGCKRCDKLNKKIKRMMP